MATWKDSLANTTTITFDCYGTLIDWRAGLNASLRELFGITDDAQAQALYLAYLSVEKQVQAESYKSYRAVLAEVAKRVAHKLDMDFVTERAIALADTLPNWPVFSDTIEALHRLKSRYRLGVLSNIDRDLFAGTARKLGVAFDFVVTAEEVHSYKPAHGHFRRLLSGHAAASEVLHVAQSLFHDGVPAGEIGLAYVWINRYNDANDSSVVPLAEFASLEALARALGV